MMDNPRREQREQIGLSQAEAGRLAGVSGVTWKKWEEDPEKVNAATRASCERLLTGKAAFNAKVAAEAADFEQAWGDCPYLTPRQAWAIAGALDVEWGGAAASTGGIVPLATWGSSYAISTEQAQLHYYGKALAAGNVYGGQRIIEVCIHYANPGNHSPTVCSDATSTGSSWISGSEHHVTFWDNLSINWPPTNFYIDRVVINPNVF